MKVTIKDVAKEAGVATSTVSRVLSNNSKISDETKEKVHKAIKKLNYKPSAIARSLANNKTRILGVILPNEAQEFLDNSFFLNAMKGISIYAQSKGYYITYVFTKENKKELDSIIDIIDAKLIDGIILLRSEENDKSINYLKKINFPFSVIGRPEHSNDVLWVDNDNFQATYNVVNKLVQRGHRNIGFIGAIENLNMSKDRLKGYTMALEINGINLNENLIIHGTDFTEEEGYICMEKLFVNNDLSAIITTDDLLAFGVRKLLNEKSIKNISLVGFNDTKLDKYQNPPLASVNINADELGYYAAKLLIDKLENNSAINNHYIVKTEFIERESFI
ncbi:LacI family DNA-binding transcriptional regulator [Paraclostridium sordellii]|uniref:HTH-type transcriptional regulator MalR n=1 Tax=Paraclostridium sordellii TaxID=1505 RepID=A0A0C7PEQ8_PARSO|nr:LacI family DNA-binding transcriptional regulator [Paeniclostridium sordellii]QYE99178.1 LacI family transcriptional regulator [Paeniclostridium sordellii]CEN77973.1 HTH-type transcriptional regulator MalR [[Clostridium] sordellii] [Paeniclostridium sordellii]CEO07099.1 HTH-type transcriptional regulator MalR [[Clostridium] sordellii] [Paeniclostridium sordellii]CEP86777.1 HTH-type transcriptional regulator MalR [[Clostridium] sordellii] [Paeniclostridium sordellii]CEP97655.1 HTH-type trans